MQEHWYFCSFDKGIPIHAENYDKLQEKIKGIIEKHSFKPIDLIELGDYVNGKRCLDIQEYLRDDGTVNTVFVCIGESVLSEDVEDIVTREQFYSKKYIIS